MKNYCMTEQKPFFVVTLPTCFCIILLASRPYHEKLVEILVLEDDHNLLANIIFYIPYRSPLEHQHLLSQPPVVYESR